MAIAFNLPGIPSQIRGTAEEAGAVPDLGQAMMQGFRSNIENVQGYPRQLAQQLLSNQLANKIRGVEAQYAEPMAKTKYDQALANLQHQGLINKFYPQIAGSQLTTAGLSQAHQRMVNEQLQRQINRQRMYDDLLEQYRKQGMPSQQAHELASQAAEQAHPEQPTESLSQSLLGAEMPEYLSNIAPQQQTPSYANVLGQNVNYTPMQQPDIGLKYTPFELTKLPKQDMASALQAASLPGFDLNQLNPSVQKKVYEALYGIPTPQVSATREPQMPTEGQAQIMQAFPLSQEAPSYLQRPEEVMAAPSEVPAMAQEQQPQSYAEQLQKAGYDTSNAIPAYAAQDQMYLERPDYREMLKKDFPNIGKKQFNDFARNRIITTETLPSGATKTTMQQLPGTLPGGGTQAKITAAVLSTPAGRSVYRNNLVETYGENSQQVKEFDRNAKQMDSDEELNRNLKKEKLELDKEKNKMQQETNRMKAEALEVRKRQGLGKVGSAYADLMDARAGYIPGTKTKFLTQDDQQKSIKTIQASINKIATDTKTREKLIAAKQIDNSLKNLDVNALVQYSGVYGHLMKESQKIKSGLGANNPEFKRYNDAVEIARQLADQVRQFYGSSIQKYSVEGYKALTNPSSWSSSPEIAKSNFEIFRKNLLQETDILKDFFVYADSADFDNKLTDAKANIVSNDLKAHEEEMRKRGLL